MEDLPEFLKDLDEETKTHIVKLLKKMKSFYESLITLRDFITDSGYEESEVEDIQNFILTELESIYGLEQTIKSSNVISKELKKILIQSCFIIQLELRKMYPAGIVL